VGGRDRLSKATNRPSGDVTCIAISPNSSFLASGTYDHKVKIWNFETGARHHTFEGHNDWVDCIAISFDSSLVASGSDDKTIRVWRIADFALVCTLRHYDFVTGVAFHPDGQWIYSVSRDGVVRLWKIVEGGKTVGILKDTGFVLNKPRIKASGDGTSLTLFTDEKSRSWKMVPFLGDRASAKLPITFVPQDQAFDDGSRALYNYTNGAEWILDQHGGRIFWLPPGLRGRVAECHMSGLDGCDGHRRWKSFLVQVRRRYPAWRAAGAACTGPSTASQGSIFHATSKNQSRFIEASH
jgi:hypothetical protein